MTKCDEVHKGKTLLISDNFSKGEKKVNKIKLLLRVILEELGIIPFTKAGKILHVMGMSHNATTV